jgi:hypothetical protein
MTQERSTVAKVTQVPKLSICRGMPCAITERPAERGTHPTGGSSWRPPLFFQSAVGRTSMHPSLGVRSTPIQPLKWGCPSGLRRSGGTLPKPSMMILSPRASQQLGSPVFLPKASASITCGSAGLEEVGNEGQAGQVKAARSVGQHGRAAPAASAWATSTPPTLLFCAGSVILILCGSHRRTTNYPHRTDVLETHRVCQACR